MRNSRDAQMRLERITRSVGTIENGLDVEGNFSTALRSSAKRSIPKGRVGIEAFDHLYQLGQGSRLHRIHLHRPPASSRDAGSWAEELELASRPEIEPERGAKFLSR